MKQSRLSRSTMLVPLATLSSLFLAGCAPSYSPNTYASNAVQLANKVEVGTVVGYREVSISTNGTVGTVVGGAAGGLLGSQYTDSPLVALGGTTVGAIVGNTIEHVAKDTTGWEYIIRKDNGELLSVTQRERTPLTLAQHVLVIMGPQARVVPDYSVAQEKPAKAEPAKDKSDAKPETPVKVELVVSLPPGVTAQATGASTIVAPPPPVGTVTPVAAPATTTQTVLTSTPAAKAEPQPASIATPPVAKVVLTSTSAASSAEPQPLPAAVPATVSTTEASSPPNAEAAPEKRPDEAPALGN